MTAYQIGQLAGAVLGAALAYKLFKSPKKVNRGMGVLVGLLALGYVASDALRKVACNSAALGK
jgi:hypothetical protein